MSEEIIERELELIKESEGHMFFSIMLGLLVIKTDYSTAIVKLNQIQAIEMVDKGDGGIVTITLKGNKSEQIVYSEDNQDKWVEAKEWLDSNILNLSDIMKQHDVLYHRDAHPGF